MRVRRFSEGLRSMPSAPTPEYVTVQFRGFDGVGCSLDLVVMVSSRYIERARPITSKPGPMLAEEQGTSGCG